MTGRHKAFTLTEIAIAILLLSIAAAYMTLNANASKHTAKQEAERIMNQIYGLIETANRNNVSFAVLFTGSEQFDHVSVDWQTQGTKFNGEIKLTKGFSVCNLNKTTSHELKYDLADNGFLPPSMTLKVKGPDDSSYNILIYVPGTRMRLSESDTAQQIYN